MKIRTAGLLAAVGVAMLAFGPEAAARLPKGLAPPTDDAADAGALAAFRGRWIVRGYPSGGVLALVEIDGEGPRLGVTLLAMGLPGYSRSKVADLRGDDRGVRFSLRIDNGRPAEAKTYRIVGYRREGGRDPDVLLGSMEVDGLRYAARLERTDREGLSPKEVGTDGLHSREWAELVRTRDIEKQKRITEAILTKYPDEPFAFSAASYLFTALAEAGARQDELLSAASRTIRLAAPHGRELELFAVHRVAWRLVETEGAAGVALDYARKAEAMLQAADPPAVRASVLKTLASALLRAGRGDEARGLADRVAELDAVLDREYLRTAPTLEAGRFAGRRGEGRRTVLMELFTGARCGPCVHADAAFDALIGTYRPEDVILIQYHMHIPGFDALANEGSVARGRYYRASYAPFACVDGRDMQLIKLSAATAAAGYRAARESIEERMETGPGAEIGLEAGRDGDEIKIRAKVTGLKEAGDAIRLRFVLVEREVRYEGSNGVRLNRHVARAFPGGIRGLPLAAGTTEHAVTVDLAELVGDLNSYLDGFSDQRSYPDNYRPLELGSLSVVAIIQDDASREVIQAAQVEVPDPR